MARGLQTLGTEHLEGLEWGFAQNVEQSFHKDILPRIVALGERGCPFQVEQYGEVRYSEGTHSRSYPLNAVNVGDWSDDTKPTVLITGGMHPYEQGGIQGVLDFLENDAAAYSKHVNFLVVPVMNPSAYDIDSRFNLAKQNPNREFEHNSGCEECKQFVEYLDCLDREFICSIDCHETFPEDIEIMKMDGDKSGLDANHMPDATYVMEDTHPDYPEYEIGSPLAKAIEGAGAPVFKGDNVLGFPNNGGIVRGLAEKISTTCSGFLLNNGYTRHAITSETFAPQDMRMEIRIAAQKAVIRTRLDTLIGCHLKPELAQDLGVECPTYG